MGTKHYNVDASLFMRNFTDDLKKKGLITEAEEIETFTTVEEDEGQSVVYETVNISKNFFDILEPLVMDLIVKILPITTACTIVPPKMHTKLFLVPLDKYKAFTDKFPIVKDQTIASELMLGIRAVRLEKLKEANIRIEYVITKEELQYKIY